MENIGYYNGKFDLIENMTIPMNDRVSYFGDGVYDVTYTRNYIPYCLDAHLDRFYSSAELLKIKIPIEKAEFGRLLCETVRMVDSPEQMVYWQVSRGTAVRNHAFPDVPANVWIISRHVNVVDLSKPISLLTVEDTRFLHCNIKTVNLIPNVMAEQAAREAGCNSAVFHRGDRVTECAHANIHIMKDGKIITPPTDNLILPGIARANIIRIAATLRIPVEIRPFTVFEMMNADEIMMSSAGCFCVGVNRIDGKDVGGRDQKTLKRLQDALVDDFNEATKLN